MTAEKILTNDEIMSEWEGTDNALSFACAIEQAVLQSPEIQTLRKDSARLKFMADEGCKLGTWIQPDGSCKYRLEWDLESCWQDQWYDSPEDALDAALEQQK